MSQIILIVTPKPGNKVEVELFGSNIYFKPIVRINNMYDYVDDASRQKVQGTVSKIVNQFPNVRLLSKVEVEPAHDDSE